MTSIQDALNQATDAAANMVSNEGALMEAHIDRSGVAQTYAKPSMATVAATTGLLPRSTMYLKPSKHGMQIGKNREMLQEFEAEILLVEETGFKLKHTIRYGNPVKYFSSYDGVSCDKGGSWGDAIAKAKMAGVTDDPYFTAEVKLVLTKDLKLKDEVLKAGTIVGYDSSSPTRFSDWTDFWEAASAAGLLGQTVKVKVTAREINHQGNSWGTVDFALTQ